MVNGVGGKKNGVYRVFKNSRCIPEEVSVRSVRASSASVDDRTSDVKRKNGGRKWDLIMNS